MRPLLLNSQIAMGEWERFMLCEADNWTAVEFWDTMVGSGMPNKKYCTITVSKTLKRETARESQSDEHMLNNVFKCCEWFRTQKMCSGVNRSMQTQKCQWTMSGSGLENQPLNAKYWLDGRLFEQGLRATVVRSETGCWLFANRQLAATRHKYRYVRHN